MTSEKVKQKEVEMILFLVFFQSNAAKKSLDKKRSDI